METFKKKNYSSHSFFKVELLVIILAIVLIVVVSFPKLKKFVFNVRLESALDSAYEYSESVSNFFVSHLVFDDSFKLNGFYKVSDGNLIDDGKVYNISMAGNVPSGGYLNYENNILKQGCLIVGNYYIMIENGKFINVSSDDCLKNDIIFEM